MNDRNLDGATLRLAKPGTTIPKDTEILLDIGEDLMYFRFGYERTTLDTGKTYIVRREQKPTVPFGSIATQKLSSDPLTVSGSLTANHVQVSVTKDPTYTARFILYPAYQGDITVPGLPEDIAQEIVQRYEEKFKVILIKGSDGIAHIIPTEHIYHIIITQEA